MKSDEEILDSLIKDGSIGFEIASLLRNKNEDDSEIGSVVGAAILGTFKASERARKSGFPFLFEENGSLYEAQTDGSKKLIEKLPENQKLPFSKYKLK